MSLIFFSGLVWDTSISDTPSVRDIRFQYKLWYEKLLVCSGNYDVLNSNLIELQGKGTKNSGSLTHVYIWVKNIRSKPICIEAERPNIEIV